MKKFNELSLVYIDKIKIIQRKGCSSDIEISLINLMSSYQKDSAQDLKQIIKTHKNYFKLISC